MGTWKGRKPRGGATIRISNRDGWVMAAAHLATTEVTSTIRRLDSFTLYETRTMLYLMGTERTKNSYRLLKISRTDPAVRIALITAHLTNSFLPPMGRS